MKDPERRAAEGLRRAIEELFHHMGSETDKARRACLDWDNLLATAADQEELDRQEKSSTWMEWDGWPKAGDVLERYNGRTECVTSSIPILQEFILNGVPCRGSAIMKALEVERVWRNGTIVWEHQ